MKECQALLRQAQTQSFYLAGMNLETTETSKRFKGGRRLGFSAFSYISDIIYFNLREFPKKLIISSDLKLLK